MPRTPLPGVRDATQRVRDLCTSEMLVVAVLRLWADFISSPRQADPLWQNGLSAARVDPDGAMAFDTLFRIVVSSVRRPLDIHRPHCQMLGRDELRLLDMVCLAQHGFHDEAGVLMADWMPPAAVRMALPPLRLFACAMDRAGLHVPMRAAASSPPAPVHASADRGAGLVH